MKKFITILLTAVLVLSLAGCNFVTYEDTNGDEDFSLQTLTEADITSNITTYSQKMGAKTMINNEISYSAKSMSGIIRIYEANLRDGNLEIQVSSEVSKGNARLVLVVGNEIVHDFDLNKDNQVYTLENCTGQVCLRLAGESAEFKVTCTSI